MSWSTAIAALSISNYAGLIACSAAVVAASATATTIWALLRLRRDYRVVEAAEHLHAVDLTSVVKRYLPGELQSNLLAEEIPLVKDRMSRSRARWAAVAIPSAALLVASSTAAFLIMERNVERLAKQRVQQEVLHLDTLQVIQGKWGWKFGFLLSCGENPHTISVSSDRKIVSVVFAKPIWDGAVSVNHFEYKVVSAGPDTLVVSLLADETDRPNRQSRFKFTDADTFDADTYDLSRSGAPLQTSGAIVRCQNPESDREPPHADAR